MESIYPAETRTGAVRINTNSRSIDMMREIQILKTFASRTEYKVLREWVSVKERDLTELGVGSCVIPAVVLGKLSLGEVGTLVNWAKQWGNQLLVFPPFHSVNLKRLQLGVDLTVNRVAGTLYEGLPLKEIFITNHQPKLQLAAGQSIALDLYYHSGSGQVTMTTLPLLDYRLLAYEEKCKEIFQQLLAVQEIQANDAVKQQEVEITPLHQHLIILAAAGITSIQKVNSYLKTCFNTTVDEVAIKLVQQQLLEGNYLTVEGSIALKGKEFIQQGGYRAFVRELYLQRE